MKRILHVANFNSLRLKGCFQCGFPVKISYGLIKNGYEVINYPDRDLCRMFGFGHMNALGKYRLNKHLINFCRTVHPDALLLGHADTITPETVAAMRKMFPDMRVMQWNCDPIVEGCDHNINNIKSKLDVVDATVISTAEKKLLEQFKQDGKPVAHMPNMVDAAIETGRTFEKENLPYDMFLSATTKTRQFCGQETPIEDILKMTEQKIPDIKWLLGGIRGTPTLNGFEYLDAFNKAAIGLNLSRQNDVYLYTSDRLAHIMGNGQMAMIERTTGFEDILGKDTAAYYGSKEEYLDLAEFYIKHPKARMKVAKNGYEAYYREFNNVLVTKFMAQLLFGEFKKPEREWQVVI